MDETVFLQLVTANQGIIHKICRLYRNGTTDREDLFQEIVFQLWKAFPAFKGNARVSTWMYRIALNTAIASFRKKKPDITYPDALPDLHEEPRVNEEQALRQDQLFNAIARLDDSEKALITLYLEELTYHEIAEIMGISENNVGVKLNRVKNKIRKLLTT
ncbi:RNA polymerase sigma factor [Hufsiella ginkgonis]|uniref:Sigma-70 family RNA polymerase sigma factor n=1 Tax=Hufsiella ginkgonis TaxID=2695274 RepID=A0A7K1XX81_9SPHI|nr:sigma-70 family RNA polymerase sigma factor [Hufsiella ginkgonis]MXV15611.1 sigma-70 family RNA polymerase sigma factor [Hufsiella ginkgonis]